MAEDYATKMFDL